MSDVLWSYRISVSSVTHFSPYFLLYGRLPRVPLSRTLPVQSTNFFGNRLDNLATALKQARVDMEQSRQADHARLLARADAHQLKVGDHCLLLANERVTLSSRFDPLWLITRLRGSTVWLHQQDTGLIRKVHRSNRDRNKEKILHVRWTCDHVRLTCPPIFSHAQKIMHRSTQNYKFRKTGTILNYFKIQQIVGRCCFM